MIEASSTIAVNNPDDTETLTRDDVWAGLVEKAENPLPYVRNISECVVAERFEGGLIRDIVHVGQHVRETVTFYPKSRVHFVRTHGIARGTIDNEISESSDGTLELTFTFRIVVDGVDAGSAEEGEFASNMKADYLDAVQTTLQAVRDRVATSASQ
ncbi:hypothetical protein CH286_02380 [Rhodococcus sp. WWJCD1]|uniref:SRPBCC family protein n=1 Tax=Rhodococcus sp. WWJCD1 TaxID=2022519 RepID=UPI000B9B8D23|nr:SRPBCC family protein [Rhodococcus sp. WWJCD1]OZC52456.1 hypothetical protein CH286_02380 [Rhodococcus sp. WWJCD1]